MLPASVILENCCFGAFSDMEYIFRVGNRWTGLFLRGRYRIFLTRGAPLDGVAE